MKINLFKRKTMIIPEENYLEEVFEGCPFCGSLSIKYIGNIHPSPEINIYSDFLFMIGAILSDRPLPDIKIYTCNNCHIRFLQPSADRKIP